jgi:hypothetical protein
MLRASIRRHPVLHTILLVMLALGLMIKPTLAAVGQIHEMTEQTALAAAADHDDQAHDEHDHGEPERDPDHAMGSHGLLHQVDASASTGLLIGPVSTASPPPCVVLPSHREAAERSGPPSTLFRPPIA